MHLRRMIQMVVLLAFTVIPALAWGEIVVYSARSEHLIKPIFDLYSSKTGEEIAYITGKDTALIERLKREGADTPADLLITVDAGNLWHAAREGVLQPLDSQVLAKNVPASLRDPENRWFGLSVRARAMVYSTERVPKEELSTYAALAEPRWKDRLILRTSKKVYNQSLVASFIAQQGREQAERVVKGWVDNLAMAPVAKDSQVMDAILAGMGDVGIVNTYYFGRFMKKYPDAPLRLFWPDQQGNGVHVNVSGAGVTAHSKNREAATKLLEWLSSEDAQSLFAGLNMEYPVNPEVKPDAVVSAWGSFKANSMNVAQYGALQAEAVKLMDRAGYR
jgi:iron(III) transport system substrate-binding protein